MSMVTISLRSSSTHSRSLAFVTSTGRPPPRRVKRDMSPFTLDACCRAFVERATTIVVGDGDGEADGEADGDAEGVAEGLADGEAVADADGALVAVVATCALGGADSARADAISVGTLDFTTLSPLTTVKRSVAAS